MASDIINYQNYQRKKVASDSPERCKGTTGTEQCYFNSIPGTQYCDYHANIGTKQKMKKAILRNYNLTKWEGRIGDKADNPTIKSLREEIGILRVIIEERLRACHTENDLLINSGAISNLIMQVEKLVRSCNHIEHSLGQYIDKTQAYALIQGVLEIVTKYVEDPEALENISNDFSAAIERSFESGAEAPVSNDNKQMVRALPGNGCSTTGEVDIQMASLDEGDA